MMQSVSQMIAMRLQLKLNFSSSSSIARQSLIGLVSKLRIETQAPISKCREALLATNNNYLLALDHVRNSLLDRGKASLLRVKREELKGSTLFFTLLANKFSISEIASETDFVSNSSQFVEMGQEASLQLLTTTNTSSPSIPSLNESLSHLFGKYSSIFGEKIQLIDHYYSNELPIENELNYGYYMHQSLVNQKDKETRIDNSIINDCGSMFSFVLFKNEFDKESKELPKQIAKHILANGEEFISKTDVTNELLLNQSFLFDEGKKIREIVGNTNEIKLIILKQKGLPIKLIK